MPTEAQSIDRKVTDIFEDGAWSGQRCFLIGGGESLNGFDLNRLNGDKTIGINKSFIHYESSVVFVSDANFHYILETDTTLSPQWKSFKNPKLIVEPVSKRTTYENVHLIKRSKDLKLPRSLSEGINVWNNSGFGALVLAYLLGANPIYLLGYDMQCKESTHWHEGYPNQTVERQQSRMHAFMLPFTMLAADFAERGVQVINLTPNSALTCFCMQNCDIILK